MEISESLQDELEGYRSSTSIIRQYLSVYAGECSGLVEKYPPAFLNRRKRTLMLCMNFNAGFLL